MRVVATLSKPPVEGSTLPGDDLDDQVRQVQA